MCSAHVRCPLFWSYGTSELRVGISVLDVWYWAVRLTRACRAVVRMATASEEELSENLRWAVVVLMVERSHKGLNTEYCHLVDGTYWSSH